MTRDEMLKIIYVFINDSIGGYDGYLRYSDVDSLLKLIEEHMIPKTKMSEPEYHENNGKQLQTKAVNKWDKE